MQQVQQSQQYIQMSPETEESLAQGHAAGVAEVERLFYGVEHNQADGLDPMDDALTL